MVTFRTKKHQTGIENQTLIKTETETITKTGTIPIVTNVQITTIDQTITVITISPTTIKMAETKTEINVEILLL